MSGTRTIRVGKRTWVNPPGLIFWPIFWTTLLLALFVAIVVPIWLLTNIMPTVLATLLWLAFLLLFCTKINGKKVWRHLLRR